MIGPVTVVIGPVIVVIGPVIVVIGPVPTLVIGPVLINTHSIIGLLIYDRTEARRERGR